MEKTPRLIQSIERSAAILEIIAQKGGCARLREIAEISGLGKTTAHNILQTLDHLGYVQRRHGDMRYHLGGRILNLARIAGDDNALRVRLRPVMLAIARASGMTVYLAVPSGDEAAYLEVVECGDASMGSRPPLHEQLEGSAVGLVFLAFVPGLRKRVMATRVGALDAQALTRIEDVRVKGYAIDIEACRPDWNCVAIPWRERGEVRASIGLTGPASRLPRARLVQLGWMMMKLVEQDRCSTMLKK